MIVVVANSLPDAVRGKIKLWFVEPRPNVFVSGVKDALSLRVVEMLLKHCPPSSGLTIFQSIPEPPFFRIHTRGEPVKEISTISGLQLIVEKTLRD